MSVPFIFDIEFLWLVGLFAIPLFAALLLYRYYERRQERGQGNHHIQRLQESDMKRERQPSKSVAVGVRSVLVTIILLLGVFPALYFFGFFGVIVYGGLMFLYAMTREREVEREDMKQRIQRLEKVDQQPNRMAVIKVRCPHCKTLNPDSAKFCNECGVALQ